MWPCGVVEAKTRRGNKVGPLECYAPGNGLMSFFYFLFLAEI